MPRHTEKRLRFVASLTSGGRILDVGWAHSPNYWLQGTRIVGLDREPRPLEPPYTEIVTEDVFVEPSKLDGQSFDTILCGEFIEHVEEPYRLLRRLRRLLAQNGRLILSTPNPIGFPRIIAEYMTTRRWYYGLGHTYMFAPRWVVRAMEFCGFRLERMVGCGIPRLPIAVLNSVVVYIGSAMPPTQQQDRLREWLVGDRCSISMP